MLCPSRWHLIIVYLQGLLRTQVRAAEVILAHSLHHVMQLFKLLVHSRKERLRSRASLNLCEGEDEQRVNRGNDTESRI